MHPESKRIIGQIIAPAGGEPGPAVVVAAPMSFEQIVHPQRAYTGPERRAQGVIIAEVLADAPGSPPAPAEEL